MCGRSQNATHGAGACVRVACAIVPPLASLSSRWSPMQCGQQVSRSGWPTPRNRRRARRSAGWQRFLSHSKIPALKCCDLAVAFGPSQPTPTPTPTDGVRFGSACIASGGLPPVSAPPWSMHTLIDTTPMQDRWSHVPAYGRATGAVPSSGVRRIEIDRRPSKYSHASVVACRSLFRRGHSNVRRNLTGNLDRSNCQVPGASSVEQLVRRDTCC